jgi:DNA-binding beta-propeller fold protein YncE
MKLHENSFCFSVLALSWLAGDASAFAADLIVSANDAKYVRVLGRDTYPAGTGPDTLTVLDASQFPPKIKATVDVEHTVIGPPQAVAITPDGKLAIVGAPTRYDYVAKKVIFDTFLQVIDLEATPPKLIDKVEIGQHSQGLSINPEGTLLLAGTVGGTVAVLEIGGKTVKLVEQIKVSAKRVSGISFTHDGRAALAALRDEQGITVLDVEGSRVTNTQEGVTTGVSPYSVDVSSDGKWAVVSNVGLPGMPGNVGRLYGDADSVTLIDVSKRPFRAVQHFTVPSIPEGVAISPDGKWIAVQSMDGSNLTEHNPGRHPQGRVLLFAIRDGQAVKTPDLPGGEAGQGIVFTADNEYILVQLNVEKQLAVYAVNDGDMKDTQQRIVLSGGPASLRSMPR